MSTQTPDTTAAEWLASPLTSERARALLARPEAIRDVIDAVKRALESMKQESIEREQCEGVKS